MALNKDFATETVELPSKGLLYSKDNPLSSGKVEVKYMTAREEDILTNLNFIKDGTVFDKLLKSLIVSDISLEDLLIVDKNAILVAARVLGYGKEYTFKKYVKGELITMTTDLTKLKTKDLSFENHIPYTNQFYYRLPATGTEVTFKLLTEKDERLIDQEIKGYLKIAPLGAFDITTKLKHMITSVNSSSDTGTIRGFVDKMLAQDAKALRKYYNTIAPSLEMIHYDEYDENGNGVGEGITIPIDTTFFWPGD